MSSRVLEGRRLLVVEDEYLIASDLLTTLEAAGARVFGPVSDLERAVEVVGADGPSIDGAILDINLQGKTVYPAAALLRERGVPFVFVTGYECGSMPGEFANTPRLGKPFSEEQLLSALAGLHEREALGG